MAYGDYENSSNVSDFSDYGIKIAKSGFNVDTAADSDLLFNSSWPSLQIVKVAHGTNAIPHTLGYPTLAIQFTVNDADNKYSGMSIIPSDTSYVYPSGVGPGYTSKVIIYNLDLTIDIDYPYTTRPLSSGIYDKNYGIKISKTNRDIDSTDMRDFVLHTRCGSPMVLAVKTEQTIDPGNITSIPTHQQMIRYINKIGYPTFVFGYVQTANLKYIPAPQSGQVYPLTISNGTTSRLTLLTNQPIQYTGKGSLVILRSPMLASNNVGVVV